MRGGSLKNAWPGEGPINSALRDSNQKLLTPQIPRDLPGPEVPLMVKLLHDRYYTTVTHRVLVREVMQDLKTSTGPLFFEAKANIFKQLMCKGLGPAKLSDATT